MLKAPIKIWQPCSGIHRGLEFEHFMAILYISGPFGIFLLIWYVVPIKIWQPCSGIHRGLEFEASLSNVSEVFCDR
jgi:hypothetical protein